MSNHLGQELPIHGVCLPDFEPVRDVFIENFEQRGEVGAAVCVYREGEKVVDLWGGYKDAAKTTPWQEDTIVCMMSVGKSMASLCALILIERGQLELSSRVAQYWPEFGQAGKEDMTVEQLLGGFAGLLYLDDAPKGCVLDWDVMVGALEKQRPEWPIGSQGAYHSMTWGYLVGELVQRVDGRDFNSFFREEITSPLNVDYQFGIPDEDLHRIVDVIPNPGSATFNAMKVPDSNIGRAWRVIPDTPDFFNSLEFRKAVFASGNGHGNAAAMARIYALLAEGGELDGVRLVSPTLIEKAKTTQWESNCGLTDRPFKYGLGFFINKPPLTPMGANPGNFGHPGAGGAIGIADTDSRMSFSYCPNFLCSGEGVGQRSEALIHAALG